MKHKLSKKIFILALFISTSFSSINWTLKIRSSYLSWSLLPAGTNQCEKGSSLNRFHPPKSLNWPGVKPQPLGSFMQEETNKKVNALKIHVKFTHRHYQLPTTHESIDLQEIEKPTQDKWPSTRGGFINQHTDSGSTMKVKHCKPFINLINKYATQLTDVNSHFHLVA